MNADVQTSQHERLQQQRARNLEPFRRPVIEELSRGRCERQAMHSKGVKMSFGLFPRRLAAGRRPHYATPRMRELYAVPLAVSLLLSLSGFVDRSLRATCAKEASQMAIELTTTVFDPGGAIPKKYTGEGPDVSPPLRWSEPPDGTKELALICDDPDAPTPKPWVHWVVYKIPPTRRGLDEDASGSFIEGRNDFGHIGYGGPMPPKGHGVHHYHFKIYALDGTIPNKPGLTKDELLAAMKGHILAEGKLIGTYERR